VRVRVHVRVRVRVLVDVVCSCVCVRVLARSCARACGCSLEPNHSHFLFVDAGPAAEGQFGKEIALRAAMEDRFCRVNSSEQEEGGGAPTVMILLVVAGGVGTLTTVLAVLQKRRPVVVLSASGGAAKFISDFVRYGVMPTNELQPSDEGYNARQQAVELCATTLPKIDKAGVSTSLLSFWDGGDSFTSVAQRGDAFKSFLLECILSKGPCPRLAQRTPSQWIQCTRVTDARALRVLQARAHVPSTP
jgi:hypothetical protein